MTPRKLLLGQSVIHMIEARDNGYKIRCTLFFSFYKTWQLAQSGEQAKHRLPSHAILVAGFSGKAGNGVTEKKNRSSSISLKQILWVLKT